MKYAVQLAVLGTTLVSIAHGATKPFAVYGKDNRQEVYEASAANKLLAKSTASLVPNFYITKNAINPALVDLNQSTLDDWLISLLSQPTLQAPASFNMNLLKDILDYVPVGAGFSAFCPGTPYVKQPNPAVCSGFLIAPDLVATAGHCADIDEVCKQYKWVFDFEVDEVTKQAGLNHKADDVYGCKKIVTNKFDEQGVTDYAVFQLDRPVKNRAPLEIRNDSKIANNQAITVIGAPSGLPTKVASGANVRSNNESEYFVANLDTFQGNSGSAVFNDTTGVVEGILVRGEEDFEVNRLAGCVQNLKCAESQCRGEDVTRMTAIPEVSVQKAFNEAAASGDLVVLNKVIAQKLWIDFYTKDGQSALIKAAAAAKSESLKLLLANQASVNLQDAKGNSALHELAKILNASNAEALKVLVDAGATVELKNDQSETALLVAASKLNLEGTKILIQAGADKNILNALGESILVPFIRSGNDQAIIALAELGVDTKPVRKLLSTKLKLKLALKRLF